MPNLGLETGYECGRCSHNFKSLFAYLLHTATHRI